MTINSSRAADLRELPLCSAYLSLNIEALPVHVRQQRSTQGLSVPWGLGALADGQLEILGVWLAPGEDDMLWHTVFRDLKARGVETIRFVSGIHLAPSQPGGKSHAAVARWEAALEQLRPSYAMTPRLRRIIRRAEEASHQLDQSLRQALEGRPCFNDGEAAISFIAESLMRAESELGSLAASSGKRIGQRGSKGLAKPSTSVAGH